MLPENCEGILPTIPILHLIRRRAAAAVQNGGDVCSTLASGFETIPSLDASGFPAAAAKEPYQCAP